MLQSILVALALSQANAASLLPLHHDDAVAPGAWVAVSRGHLWICWQGPQSADPALPPPNYDCWQRVPLELARGATLGVGAELRVRFRDPDNLWIYAQGQGTWIVGRSGIAIPTQDAPTGPELSVLSPLHCSPSGWLPIREEGHWSWVRARCKPAVNCRRHPRIRRRPTGVRLGLALDVALLRRGLTGNSQQKTLTNSQVLISLTFALDRRQARADRQALARWRRPGLERTRSLPTPQSSGALAKEERLALERSQCRAWEGLQ
ncbi:MAG TPA: hypothetical protein ENJ18_17965 [Nannocystis exedens]|nr:hypothetical protein [Nannocystis exedens]